MNFGASKMNFGASKMNFGASKLDFGASKMDFGASKLDFGASKLDFEASKMDFEASKSGSGASETRSGTSNPRTDRSIRGGGTPDPTARLAAAARDEPLQSPPRRPTPSVLAISTPGTRMQIAEFQRLIRDRYFETDSARGAAATFLWLTEEFGELAEAIGKDLRGDGDPENLAGEFADVLAWLATLANVLDVDLTAAIESKYLTGGGPKGVK